MGDVADFIAHQRRRGILESSITKARGNLHAFERWLEPRPLLDATPADVNRFLDAKRITARTRYGWISLLHTFYMWAVDEGRAETDPTSRVPRPKLRPGLPRPISDDDLKMALDFACPRMRAWLKLAAYGGLRCIEISNLRREDILDAHRLIRVLGKGQKERLVPVHPKIEVALRAYGMPRAGHVFLTQQQTPWSPARISRAIAVFFDDLGIDATAHQLRHWFATKAYEGTRDIKVVQELLGHSSPTTTSVYAAFSQQFAREAVEALPVLR